MKNRDRRIMKLFGALTVAMFAFGLAQDGVQSIDLAESSEHGQYLVDQAGMTLYMFAPDAQGPSTCYDDCATNWPPVTVASADALPAAAEGLDAALFGTVERDDGTFQVTYNGWPLYYYAGDMEAGATTGQGLGDNWYILDATGTPIGMDAAAPDGDDGDDGEDGEDGEDNGDG